MPGKEFNFWQDHSMRYLEMAHRFDRRERLAHPDGYGKRTGDCGDTVEIFLTARADRIQHICYDIDGCRNTNAAANAVCHLCENKPVAQAWEITPQTVFDFLETMPSENFHCAELAVGALYRALANLSETRRQPWKKLYR